MCPPWNVSHCVIKIINPFGEIQTLYSFTGETSKEIVDTSMVFDIQNHSNVFVESVCNKEKRGGWGGERANSRLTAIGTHNCDCTFLRVYPIELICVSMPTVIALIVDINLM